jgi:hypothetical protein
VFELRGRLRPAGNQDQRLTLLAGFDVVQTHRCRWSK